MTEISNNAPLQDGRHQPVSISLTAEQGRKIEFAKPCLHEVSIERRVNQGSWQQIAQHVRFPFLDEETFNAPVELEYRICISRPQGKAEEYFVEASLH